MLKINNLIEEINIYLNNYFKEKGSYNKIIYEASGYSVNIGGKRVRPLLMLLTYYVYSGQYKNILEMSAALEMIHTYSLIHDDLPCMDNDDLRRGKPTNHKIFGENIAVLAGDALLNEAMIVLMKYSLSHGEKALKASYEIAYAAGAEGMIGGQIVDVISEGKKISKEQLHYMHAKKTGALINAAIISGAIMGEAPEEDIKKLNLFGEKLGMVFQIKDDILDVVGDAVNLGKKVHVDEENNKTNYISVYGLEKCKELCIQMTEECIELLNSLTVNCECLIELTKKLLYREK